MTAVTAKFEQMILEIETTPESGTYAALCGLTDVTINRTSNIDTTEVPNCNDESLPLSIERAVRSQEVTISATGVWALQSHETIMGWWYGGSTLNIRLRNAKVEADGATGDTETEAGPALLVSLNNSRTKGQKVTAELEINFDGVPTRTAKV
ncbi:phage tail tube protein [Nitratireductor sp. GZWM139]|uniref:phage tail tube protein n=1 Tax=Nitratireductor sp. GZWM139 TaxID=2950541 RepID=UPI0024BE41AF|nr:phage tail tube protein [Nitratireductor sp. GZWM139]MDJ1463331.1 phage tail protein [Nitratireductor sp. GZWM139]